jgi:hypothetical protein
MLSHCISIQPCEPDRDTTAGVCMLRPTKELAHPQSISKHLNEYDYLFATPTSLPLPRDANHSIPLITGAQPVKIRLYKYNPIQKDEINKQLKEMLKNGVITPSSSPFASSVLLVKKKDGT